MKIPIERGIKGCLRSQKNLYQEKEFNETRVDVCNSAHWIQLSLAYQIHPLTRKEKHILDLVHKFYKVRMGSYLAPKT